MKILVTAGPTREALDPVRFLSNRSSGRMGYAVAGVAQSRGHEVILVSGPVSLAAPDGVRVERVVSAADMLAAVERHVAWCDVLVMAAAVADWRPAAVSARKLKKTDGPASIDLERTTDILQAVRAAKGARVFVGFAAETEDLLGEAGRKLAAKGLDMIVANDVSRADAGFEVENNRVTILTPGGAPEELPLMAKRDVAQTLLSRLEDLR